MTAESVFIHILAFFGGYFLGFLILIKWGDRFIDWLWEKFH